MIGVLHNTSEATAVAEFFQLFKTPWEPYITGRSYEVVITTVGTVPEVDAKLLIVFGSAGNSLDPSCGRLGVKETSPMLDSGSLRLPIYGGVLTFEPDDAQACLFVGERTAGFWKIIGNQRYLRIGYDLFREVAQLLSFGQPVQHARIPTLDLHIDALRVWILQAGLVLVEVSPMPASSSFIVCLTHDVDFIGIRYHRFDHTMWGFLFRATFGAALRFLRGRITLGHLVRCWIAALSLPLVQMGWRKDFWLPFTWYLEAEKNLPVTYYLIPFKGRAGDKVLSEHSERRATAYDVSDLPDWIHRLMEAGCEIGVHGIDAWHSVERGKEERRQITSFSEQAEVGIRMHWLLADAKTIPTLEEAGYSYDATAGYNETPGYRAGTSQVYRPAGAQQLLELPLHIQDGALFFPQRLDLRDHEAWNLCAEFIDHAETHGGTLTILWHDRSHGPERFWGDFYVRLIARLKALNVWFGTAGQVVDWFRARRAIIFERSRSNKGEVIARYDGDAPERLFNLRIHRPEHETNGLRSAGSTIDTPWSGESVNLSDLIRLRSYETQSLLSSQRSHMIERGALSPILPSTP